MKLIYTIFCTFLVLQLSAQDKIGNSLQAAMFNNGPHDVMIVMKEQPKITSSHLIDKNSKAHFVYQKLAEVAEKSQNPIGAILDINQIDFRSYNIVNAITLKADNELILQLSQRDDVRKIIYDPWFKIDLPIANKTVDYRMTDTTYGIQMINADKVWDMGFDGTGITVAGQDTGYDWDVDPLKTAYRGWNEMDSSAIHDYNWHDAIHEISPLHNDSIVTPDLNPCGLDAQEPCDDNSHGTHTMGTMVGSTEEEFIGVAPGADWIGCRSLERGWGKLSTYTECFEFFLAPTDLNGENPNPDLAPHIINNSWYCPAIEGCTPETWEVMEIVMKNLVESGIFIVVSAGNLGPDCGAIDAPPAIFSTAFTVGAVNSDELIAEFSSRGPIVVDSTVAVAPHVVAPGVEVRSVVVDGGFANFTGTSMSGPHAAGAIALLLSSDDKWIGDHEAIKNIMTITSRNKMSTQDCNDVLGQTIPNAVYGHGIIDIHEAVKFAQVASSTKDHDVSLITIYPNPSKGLFTIESESQIQNLDIFDLTGQLLFSKTKINTLKTNVDIEHLPDGVYIFQIRNEHSVNISKVRKI